ncbi:MAG: endonuclease MutS2, partial [Clostridia bacterium]|nr:endonuclease MutS2 [Clostridia bacterium]
MTDFARAENTLEYYKIIEMMATLAAIDGAKEVIRNTHPSCDPVIINRLQKQTTDAKTMTATLVSPSFGGVVDVTASVDRAGKGACLTPRELLRISDLLYTADRLIAYASGKNTDPGCLGEMFFRLFPDNTLQREIRRILPDEETVADDASPKLYEIRRAIKNTNAKIRETLQKYVAADARYTFLQDNIVTQRDGRYVIPVKVEHKNEIKGLVHDTSSSGATLFIEPMAVVEANNELRELEGKEKKEIERILYMLSSNVADIGDRLILNYKNTVELAVIFARAELSWKMKATEPIICETGEISIKKARHPLLNQETVVPTDIRLGKEFDTLVITGPNTGGKTVSLKTLGLFTLMAQTGMHIPAAGESRIRIFEKVLTDIGDEHSIEQSLSTFSAHM